MKDWKKEKPNKEGLIWIYWNAHGHNWSRMVHWSKDEQITDSHFGMLDFSDNLRSKIKKWEYV